jgi:hypothetical protein
VLGPPISLTGVTKSGVSTKNFKLDGGSYTLDFTIAAPTGGCSLDLFLATKANGPSVEDGVAVIAAGGSQDGSLEWTGVPAGTYILQEDHSGVLSCNGAWSATLTPHS